MKESPVPHDSPPHQHEHEQGSGVMLAKVPSPWQHPPSYLNASTGSAISSVNGTLVVHVKADAYNSIANTNSDVINTTTISYEQLSKEFYRSYDPSIGLHTAAVLGGILVWLVLYVIYRTKVRKYVIRVFKKRFGSKADLDTSKDSNGENTPNMVRPLINPSIVIETSPPDTCSLPPSPGTCDQYTKGSIHECMSPQSLMGRGINEDGTIFQFPCQGYGGSQQHLQHYHQPYCPDQPEFYIQLPKSELDIPSATAQWVQNMPLVARSHQDFAGLMLSLQSHGLLAMHKPCSCPLVCPKSPQPLPLLDLPNSWNKSLPVLSNSLSSQLLSAYETATANHNNDKDFKDIINSKRKREKTLQRQNKYSLDAVERMSLEQCEELDSNRRHSCIETKGGYGHYADDNKKRVMKTPPNLTIQIPDSSDPSVLNNSSVSRSPVPIPVTPTVMIQTSKPLYRRHHGCDSNTSVSSSSSADLLLAPPHAPPRHYSEAGSSRIPSPHLLSPKYDKMKSRGNTHFSWNREDIKRYQDGREPSGPGSTSPHACRGGHHRCSFKYNRREGARDSFCQHPAPSPTSCALRRHSSLGDTDKTHGRTFQPPQSGLSRHHRSLSDYNYHRDFLTGNLSPTPREHYKSLSSDPSFSLNMQRERASSTYSNESNKNSMGTHSSYSHSPSPHLLQVPDPSNLLRPMTPDFGNNSKHHPGMYKSGSQPSMRHCVHSDSNIAYYSGQYLPVAPLVDSSSVRRHSTFAPGSGEINLSFCGDNTVRASSSCGSSGSYNSAHHHPHLPHTQQQRGQHPHQHHCQHHSTGMLAVSDNAGRHGSCSSHASPNLNRSYSAVMMETKL